ncbi:ribonuclease VapC [Nocardioides psychrotolerans]|uniref:Ribonuclease VapC n=1 Tax=Nocardioides psychrotolerans TaxID=1005945 RepID=A0A1I3CWY1_9ACTN|nr:type II toxin-antitoxin system VapC family toxin [Nocardioides psychrotolerans]GEP36943.1 ribonuclease VapC [Nocardioides psychrotolerans]SFH79050.1 hypothetical protein/hypothetical protein [Nocardioides psychrotolerans]
MIVYLESSAAAKLLVEEPESAALVDFLTQLHEDDVVASAVLLETEMRRFAARVSLPQEDVTSLVDGVRLLRMGRKVFHTAGVLPGTDLRSLDALHLATAVLHEADVMVTYDRRLLAAASAVGLPSLSP